MHGRILSGDALLFVASFLRPYRASGPFDLHRLHPILAVYGPTTIINQLHIEHEQIEETMKDKILAVAPYEHRQIEDTSLDNLIDSAYGPMAMLHRRLTTTRSKSIK